MLKIVTLVVLLSISCGFAKENVFEYKSFNETNSELKINGVKPIDITDRCEFYDKNILPRCFWIRQVGKQGIIIRDSISFQEFGRTIISESPYKNMVKDCDTSDLPIIDFSKFALLSILTTGSGCSATYHRKILNDTKKRKLIYEITVNYEGSCEMSIGHRNWVMIPKVPDNYIVEYQIK